MTEWQSTTTAPHDQVIWLGCESDPAVDKYMFFVDFGWRYKDGFWSVASNGGPYFYSHWAPITSPVPGAAVTFHSRGNYFVNEEEEK